MGEPIMQPANRSLMPKAHAAAGHESAAEALASEAAADSVSAEAAATETAGMTTAEAAAAAVTTATTPTATRFGNAGRGADDDRRSKCSFDCKCRDIHVCTHDLRKPRSINPHLRGSFRDAPSHRRAIRQFAARDSSFDKIAAVIRITYSVVNEANLETLAAYGFANLRFSSLENKCRELLIGNIHQRRHTTRV
jgi:hypothetical protein